MASGTIFERMLGVGMTCVNSPQFHLRRNVPSLSLEREMFKRSLSEGELIRRNSKANNFVNQLITSREFPGG